MPTTYGTPIGDVTTVAEFPRTFREVVRAELFRVGTQPGAQLRIFAWTPGGMRPTRRGVAVAIDKLPALRAAVTALEDAARAAGLLDALAPTSGAP
jgi:hypothetical protein